MDWSRTHRNLATLALVGVMLGASGCAVVRPAAFVTEQAVLTSLGTPTSEWLNPDGSRTLEYATQPDGTTCWRYTVSAQGQIVGQYDALARDNLNRVKNGMSSAEVRSLLGPERSIQQFRASAEEVWDWNVARIGYDQTTRFKVHFHDDKVVRTSYVQHGIPTNVHIGVGFGRGYAPGWGLGWGWGHPFRPWGYPYGW